MKADQDIRMRALALAVDSKSPQSHGLSTDQYLARAKAFATFIDEGKLPLAVVKDDGIVSDLGTRRDKRRSGAGRK